MSRPNVGSDQMTAVLLTVIMVLSVSVVSATAAVGAPSTPDTGGGTDADAPVDNSTVPGSAAMEVDIGSPLETADAALASQDGDASIARGQLELAGDLRSVSNNPQSQRGQTLNMTNSVLSQRKKWATSQEKPLPSSMASRLKTSQTKLDAAQKLLETNDQVQNADVVTRAVTLAKRGTQMQATLGEDSLSIGQELPSIEIQQHGSPSGATMALLHRYSVTPTAEDVETMRALDDLPAPTRNALTDYLDAFLAFQRATATDNVTQTFAARNQLLDETEALNDALDTTDGAGIVTPQHDNLSPGDDGVTKTGGKTQVGCVNKTVPTGQSSYTTDQTYHFCVLQIGDGTGQTYSDNTVVLIDQGGDDTYHNNAGGTNLDDDCNGPVEPPSLSTTQLGDYGEDQIGDIDENMPGRADDDVAAALVDFGGDDTYTRANATGCGQRGGADLGSGFLVDTGGNDTYGNATAYNDAHRGTNGGASALLPNNPEECCREAIGTGFLLDGGAGTDTYTAGGEGANGGASDGDYHVFGFLMDTKGPSTYNATAAGTNGGGRQANGFLADLGTTDDTYTAEAKGTNGGGIYQSKYGGFILDAGGTERYHATSQGTNGGGAQRANGFLLDAGANNRSKDDSRDNFTTGHAYNDDLHNPLSHETGPISRQTGFMGVNGGGRTAGVGVLVDVTGGSLYKAGDGQGANGGGFEFGSGTIVDGGGKDTYISGYDPTNGMAWHNPVAPIYFPSAGTNGGGAVGGVGGLVDHGGSDTFDARDGHRGGVNGTNGGAWALGTGAVGLVASIGGGEDIYKAVSEGLGQGPVTGANGGASGYGDFVATNVIGSPVGITNNTLHGLDNEINETTSKNITNLDDIAPDVKHQSTTATRATGSLVDVEGVNDTYKADTGSTGEPVAGVNGGAYGTTSTGTLIDSGKDVRVGSGLNSSSPTDSYEALDQDPGNVSTGENGGVFSEATANPQNVSVKENTTGVALLLDVMGTNDSYTGDYCGSNSLKTEDTVVPKGFGVAGKGTGIFGAQIDSSSVVDPGPEEYGCGNNLPVSP